MRNQNLIRVLIIVTLGLPGLLLAADHQHHGDHGERQASPENARVYFIGLEDGATLDNPVTLRFGLSGMGVAPAGVNVANTGHHHMLINLDPADIDFSSGLPANDQIRHFGGGQTEVTLNLPEGTHTLRLLLGDWLHIPHDPPVISDPVTVTVR